MDWISVLRNSQHIVVYPCAGTDWQAITFTTKEFLQSRIVEPSCEYEQIHEDFKDLTFYDPDTLLYIDKNKDIDFYSKDKGFSNILFEDKKQELKICLVKD